MIATPRFVFLHLHKSGGTFVNECLLRFIPGARQLGYHLPWSAVPRELASLPVLGFVRNPWSYYVSWYSFQAARPTPNALYRVLSAEGRLGFKGTIQNMLRLECDGELLQRVAAALPPAYTNQGLNLPGFALARMAASGLGFYSFLFKHLFGGAPQLHIGRMENLRTDLVELLQAVGQAMSADMRQHVGAAAASNVSHHASYGCYYDDELRDLVAERDGALIRRFGYRFVP
jgi:hypothetical protein